MTRIITSEIGSRVLTIPSTMDEFSILPENDPDTLPNGDPCLRIDATDDQWYAHDRSTGNPFRLPSTHPWARTINVWVNAPVGPSGPSSSIAQAIYAGHKINTVSATNFLMKKTSGNGYVFTVGPQPTIPGLTGRSGWHMYTHIIERRTSATTIHFTTWRNGTTQWANSTSNSVAQIDTEFEFSLGLSDAAALNSRAMFNASDPYIYIGKLAVWHRVLTTLEILSLYEAMYV